MRQHDKVPTALKKLRAHRVHELLGIKRTTNVSKYRDELLASLFELLASDPAHALSESAIDSAVSVALAFVDESEWDRLASILVAANVLARADEYARLRRIGPLFRYFAGEIEEDRPYLGVALRAFAEILDGQHDWARSDLNLRLGFGGSEDEPPRRVPSTRQQLGDIFVAAALRRWLMDKSLHRLQQARAFALQSGEALMFSISELLLSYAEGSNLAELVPLARATTPILAQKDLQAYFDRKGEVVLFPAQKYAIERGALDPGSKILAMPTSSGKTLMAELRIAAELTRNQDKRVLYVTPYKLLSRQVYESLRRSLRYASISVGNLDDNLDFSSASDMTEVPDVAILTPERLDSLLRLSTSSRSGAQQALELLDSVALVVFDEIQMVGRQGRGPRLEMLLASIREVYPNTNVLGLAALGGKIDSLSSWLSADPIIYRGMRPTGLIELCWRNDGKIVQRVDGLPSLVGELARTKTAIDSAVALAMQVQTESFPVVIVETQRGFAEEVIRRIAARTVEAGLQWRSSMSPAQANNVDLAVSSIQATLGESHELGKLVRHGLAYHHAGLPAHLLSAIEHLVRLGAVRFVGATTTVAEGADLPFKLVIIPHINFGRSSKPIDKELYHNIAGRVGRASAAIEGFVLTIAPSSGHLSTYVENVLWDTNESQQLQSQLEVALGPIQNLESYRSQRDVDSHILSWLSSERSYVPNQAKELAARTYCGHRQPASRAIENGFATALERLENLGLAEAASPYRLTRLGRQASITSLSPASCVRLSDLLRNLWYPDMLSTMSDSRVLTDVDVDVITRVVFETEEVLEQSMWFQRERNRLKDEKEAARLLQELMAGNQSWPYEHDTFRADIQVFSNWLTGKSYGGLADLAPIFDSGSLSSFESGVRVLDVTEYLNRVAFAAAWAWSGVRTLLAEEGDNLPWWIRHAIEYGVASESAVECIRRLKISRSSAILISNQISYGWKDVRDYLMEQTPSDLRELGLPISDVQSISAASEARASIW